VSSIPVKPRRASAELRVVPVEDIILDHERSLNWLNVVGHGKELNLDTWSSRHPSTVDCCQFFVLDHIMRGF
jgi:hypothetical protein